MHFAWTAWRLGSGGADGDWADLGYDLDDWRFEPGGFPHCKPVEGAKPKNVVQDGPLGQNNSFGKNMMPIILPLSSDAPQVANTDLASGTNGMLLTLDALGPELNQLGLTGRLRRAASPGKNGANVADVAWSAAAPDTELTGYVRDGTLVLRGGRVFVHFSMHVAELWLPIRSVLVTARLESGKLVHGRMAGVLATEDLVTALAHVAKLAGYCGTTFQAVTDQTGQTADLPVDGQHDPDRMCDATSIALGFDAAPSLLGADADLSVLVPSRCDGGSVEGFGDP